MSHRILKYPEPVLRSKAKKIENIDGKVKELADGMVEAMAKASGIGLAAPQIGELARLIIVDVAEEFHILINPQLLEVGDEAVAEPEGCLSIPGVEAEVNRPWEVLVKAVTLSGKEVELHREGLLARVLQHEIDHLNGVLFIDHLGEARRVLTLKEYRKLRKEGEKRESPPRLSL